MYNLEDQIDQLPIETVDLQSIHSKNTIEEPVFSCLHQTSSISFNLSYRWFGSVLPWRVGLSKNLINAEFPQHLLKESLFEVRVIIRMEGIW